MVLDNVRIVLTRPQGAVNVGATARAMKNMGLSDLGLVSPEPMDDDWVRGMAVHAGDVLDKARRFESLDAAVADCGLVVGTTARDGPYRSHPLSPQAAALEITRVAATARVAVVFGPEDHGLSNDDLKACQQLISIPSSAEYPSLNLSQAVMVCSYEIFLAATRAEGWTFDETRPQPAPASDVQFMFERLEQAFLSIGFLIPENPAHIMYAFRRMLGRAHLEERDVRIFLGLARQIEWYSRNAGRKPGMPDANVEITDCNR